MPDLKKLNNMEQLRTWFRSCPFLQKNSRFRVDHLAENCGLSGQDFRAALVAGTYTETVRRQSRLSRDLLGIHMVPTILSGKKRLEGFVPNLIELKAWLDAVR